MNKEISLSSQKLQHELFLLNSLLVITPKRKEQPKMSYDVEQSKTPVQNMQADFDNHDSINLKQEDMSGTSNARVVIQKPNQNKGRENKTITTKKNGKNYN